MSWAKVALGDLCHVSAGGTPSRGKASYFEGDIPWVKISDMLQGTIQTTDESISEEGLANSSAKLFPKGTLLLSIFATVGRTAVLGIPAATNQAIAGITPKGDRRVDLKYLRHYLDASVANLLKQSRGVAQVNINLSILKGFQIPLPPLLEQQRIAAILDKAEELRAKRRAAVALLDQLPQSIFLEMFGDPKEVKTWKELRISDFCHTGSGGTPSRQSESRYYMGGTIPWVKSGELRESVIYQTEERITSLALAESSAKMVPAGAILLAMYGATVGRLAILGISAATNQAVCNIVPDAELADTTYLYHALQNLVPSMISMAAGGAQPNISQNIIRSLCVALPPLDLQCEFASRVSAISRTQTAHQSALAQLDFLLTSLQHRAFNKGGA
ncbi:MAG: restriction endonuclease subunit S [Armatimonadetes bacterium]|nr:restriction endonuclease subunit S [Armatimonadota bacterium]